MRSIFQFLRPAPFIEPIQNEEDVKKLYQYWRVRILYSTFFGYALYYFTRNTFIFAAPAMMDLGILDKSQFGILGTIWSIAYGLSKFGSGLLCDRMNPRYFMAIGLFMTAVVNILFGLSSSMFLFMLFWGLNGWFQGFGWPPCSRYLTHWYSQSERGRWWSIWTVSHNVGAFLLPILVGFTLQTMSWQWALFLPGAICLVGSFFLFERLRDTPQSLGLPAIEKYRNDFGGVSEARFNKEQQLPMRRVLIDYVFKNKFIWLLAFAYFFVYVVRIGVNNWTAIFLREERQYSLLGANFIVSLFEVGGFAGSLFAGWASDMLYGARRGPVNVIFATVTLFSLLLFWTVPAGNSTIDAALMFMIGFGIFGPQMLIGMAAAELSHKKATASSTGFVGYMAYMGSAVAGYPLGYVTQGWGWEGYCWFMGVCCVIAILLLIPTWNASKNSLSTSAEESFA